MKKTIALLAALLLCLTAFAACRKYTPDLTAETEESTSEPESVSVFAPETTAAENASDADGTTAAAETTAAPETTVPAGTTAPAGTEAPATQAPAETEAPVTESPATEAPATEAPAQPADGVRVSAKGYEIRTVNGLTYVDGLLIANKTYSLPADYAPGDLTGDTYAAYYTMKNAAAEDGIELFIVSGYRSYELQSSLYSRYSASDGKAAADRYSARPGHSEHQTGYAMDLNSLSQSFADTAEGRWIAENCWDYGFILRYPKSKEAQTGYIYEPWHLRYVGVEKALAIRDSGLCLEEFYGLTSAYQD